MIHNACQHEQQIREPIDVPHKMKIDMLETQRDDGALGTTADGTRKMQQRTRAAPTRQYEAAEGRQLGFAAIDPCFEASNVGVAHGYLGNSFGNLLPRISQLCADGEQVLLNAFEQVGDVTAKLALRSDGSEAGVQLVNVAVSRNPRIGFGYARAPEQPRLALVTCARVNLHGRQYT